VLDLAVVLAALRMNDDDHVRRLALSLPVSGPFELAEAGKRGHDHLLDEIAPFGVRYGRGIGPDRSEVERVLFLRLEPLE